MRLSTRGVTARHKAIVVLAQSGNLDLVTLSKRDSGMMLISFIVTLPLIIPLLFLESYDACSYAKLEFGLRNPFLISNLSCYQRKLMEQARTKRATLSSKPLAVTAWIDLGSKRSSKLRVVSTILRMEACR